MNNKEKILEIVSGTEKNAIDIRRHIHKNPELSFCENNTMKYICSKLDEINVEYKANVAGTGVVAHVWGEKSSDAAKTLLIRTDIDALPILEKSDKEYVSQNPGVMHACGHDGHTAILLSVCKAINNSKKDFSGCVKFVFQPGEETSGGAKPMIDEGILENPKVDACIALHMDPDIDTGSIRIKSGPLYASPDDFKIIVRGKGGHGAEPDKCINPITVGAHIVNELNTLVEREVNSAERAVVTVCSIHSGSASNIIPASAEIVGTARSLTNEMRDFLKLRIGEIAQTISKSYGAQCDYEYTELYPPLINDDTLARKLYDVALNYNDKVNCIFGGEATMAGEDFSYFSQDVPGVLFKLGCRCEDKGITYPLHHESFDIDEDCLKYGILMLSAFAIDYLN